MIESWKSFGSQNCTLSGTNYGNAVNWDFDWIWIRATHLRRNFLWCMAALPRTQCTDLKIDLSFFCVDSWRTASRRLAIQEKFWVNALFSISNERQELCLCVCVWSRAFIHFLWRIDEARNSKLSLNTSFIRDIDAGIVSCPHGGHVTVCCMSHCQDGEIEHCPGTLPDPKWSVFLGFEKEKTPIQLDTIKNSESEMMESNGTAFWGPDWNFRVLFEDATPCAWRSRPGCFAVLIVDRCWVPSLCQGLSGFALVWPTREVGLGSESQRCWYQVGGRAWHPTLATLAWRNALHMDHRAHAHHSYAMLLYAAIPHEVHYKRHGWIGRLPAEAELHAPVSNSSSTSMTVDYVDSFWVSWNDLECLHSRCKKSLLRWGPDLTAAFLKRTGCSGWTNSEFARLKSRDQLHVGERAAPTDSSYSPTCTDTHRHIPYS